MKHGLLSKAFHLYYDGFRTMTLGKTLWTIILIKLAIIFLVLKLFFFPDYIDSKAPNKDKADFVSHEMQRDKWQSHKPKHDIKTKTYNNNLNTFNQYDTFIIRHYIRHH